MTSSTPRPQGHSISSEPDFSPRPSCDTTNTSPEWVLHDSRRSASTPDGTVEQAPSPPLRDSFRIERDTSSRTSALWHQPRFRVPRFGWAEQTTPRGAQRLNYLVVVT